MMELLHKIINLKKVFTRPLSLFTFSCIISLGTLLLYNIPFFNSWGWEIRIVIASS